jgi:hypothetical protein
MESVTTAFGMPIRANVGFEIIANGIYHRVCIKLIGRHFKPILHYKTFIHEEPVAFALFGRARIKHSQRGMDMLIHLNPATIKVFL